MTIKAVVCSMLMLIPVIVHAGEKEDLAEEILILTGVQNSADIAVDQMLKVYDSLLKNADMSEAEKEKAVDLEKKARLLIQEEFKWENIKEAYIMLYVETYTLEELKGMAQFYKSDIGQKILKKLPAVTEKVMVITQDRMRKLIPKMSEIINSYKEYFM